MKNIVNTIRNLKISIKLIISFSAVVSILMLVILYQAYSITRLSALQDKTTLSYSDSVRITDIKNNLTNIYIVFSDLIINHSFYDFEKNKSDINTKFTADIEFLKKRIKNEDERKKNNTFIDSYKDMIVLFESTANILKTTGTVISGEIIIYDQGMISQLTSSEEYLDSIIKEYNHDAESADKLFKRQKASALLITVIFTITALTLCAFLIFLIHRYIIKNIQLNIDFTQKLAMGNLTERLKIKSDDEFGILAGSLNSTTDNIESMIQNIQSGMLLLVEAVADISSGNQNLSQRTSEQASMVEEIASTIEESADAYRQNYENANTTSNLANQSSELAREGGTMVDDAIVMMDKVNSSSRKISEIINLINEIAFQTNLLALNAAVEAARAGDHGRGFAVVAGEVRNLAQRASSASKEIAVLIRESVNNATDGSEKVNLSGEALKKIIDSSLSVNQMVTEITAVMNEQNTGISQINTAITELDSMTQQNAALVEEIASSSEEMHSQAIELKSLISRFKIRDL